MFSLVLYLSLSLSSSIFFSLADTGVFCLLSVDVCRMGANLKSVSTDCISASVTSCVSSADVVGGISLP
ncbi:hypothetical protein Hanom_Chr00s022523g01761751 [Helianthus anomalus]